MMTPLRVPSGQITIAKSYALAAGSDGPVYYSTEEKKKKVLGLL